MRFSDTDALGHVNNVSFAAYAETGRVDFLKRLGTLGQTIWADGHRAAEVRSVAVHFDYAVGRPIELTTAIRRELEPMLRARDGN